MLEVLPFIPITVLPGLSTKYGPDSDPVGLGVTLSYNKPISLPDLQEDLPKIVESKNHSSCYTKLYNFSFGGSATFSHGIQN